MSILAIIPARMGSRGCPGKNTRRLGGHTLVARAAMVGRVAGCRVVVTSDASVREQAEWGCQADHYLCRSEDLASDTAAMIDVVRHVLAEVPEGNPIVLLQPTQPFRTPAHIRAALDLLASSGADSVVSVVELPASHHPHSLCVIGDDGRLKPFWTVDNGLFTWADTPQRRQDVIPAWRRDGTCYVFKRSTVERHGTIYGADCRPLIIPAEESCELDTEENWAEVERRWAARAQP